jgi:hypothetical protein
LNTFAFIFYAATKCHPQTLLLTRLQLATEIVRRTILDCYSGLFTSRHVHHATLKGEIIAASATILAKSFSINGKIVVTVVAAFEPILLQRKTREAAILSLELFIGIDLRNRDQSKV